MSLLADLAVAHHADLTYEFGVTKETIGNMKTNRTLMVALLLGVAPAFADGPLAAEAMDVSTGKWRTTDDNIEGWDWSLPPRVTASPGSGLKFGGDAPAGFAGNRIGGVNWDWRKIEPEEGKYEFEPLRQAILKTAEKYDGVELHVRASVWELRDFPDKGTYPKSWAAHRESNASAPRWLAKYNIPLIEEKPKFNVATAFQVVNMDIFHPEYHSRYMKMLEAFGKSGIPRMDEITVCMIHVKSGSRGEEGAGPETGPGAARFEERMRAWAGAFKGVERNLCYVAHKGKHLDLAYELGMGQRNGFVEMYMMHADNPQLGQRVDEDGYLVVDDAFPLIAENRASGDENEEYQPSVHVPRFGPMELWPHRYRESMLRSLQMRRNFLWAEPDAWVNPPLLNYVGLELGKSTDDAPDAWCSLRESYIGLEKQPPRAVKNFERWLYQRDRPGSRTVATAKVAVSDKVKGHHPQRFFDYSARRTDQANGDTSIGFAIDDRFLRDGPHSVAIKVTYHDIGKGAWSLVVKTADGTETRREVACRDTGKIRTATFFIGDALFPAAGVDADFAIETLHGDATVGFVRVVKREGTL
jgi:hypothetical protein